MGTVHITEQELILIAATLDFAYHILSGWPPDKARNEELDKLRKKLLRDWVEDDHENG